MPDTDFRGRSARHGHVAAHAVAHTASAAALTEHRGPCHAPHPVLLDPAAVVAAADDLSPLVAVWQYGSSVRCDFRPGHSDLDILVAVVDTADTAECRAVVDVFVALDERIEVTVLKQREIAEGLHPGWSSHFYVNVARTGLHLYGPDLLALHGTPSWDEARARVVHLAQRARLVVTNPKKQQEETFWAGKYQSWVPLCLIELLDMHGHYEPHPRRALATFTALFPAASAVRDFPFPDLVTAYTFLDDLAAWLPDHRHLFAPGGRAIPGHEAQ